MCGLLGLAFSRNAELRRRLPGALHLLEHRGPDGEGTWADNDVWLGHRRLAIIDLDARSDQPMVDEETGAVLVYNGEVYNYRELRVELESAGVRFRTQSDSEVLLKAYRHWGPSAFERMNGMWAVAIWEPRHRRLFLCRDRFGVKPLYYAAIGEGLAFASEPKALLAIAPELAEPNPRAIARLVVSSESFYGEDTYFRNIRSAPAASWAIVREGEAIEFQRFWSYPEAEDAGPLAASTEQEEFDSLLESAVKLRFRSDVAVGLTLSGGLDSTAILAAAKADRLSGFKAFTATFQGDAGELPWAESAAERAECELIPVVSSGQDWIPRLRTIVWHMDAPGFSPAVFPLWNIMARAREEGVPVLLEGQGADELLGGYGHHAAARFWHLARTSGVLSALRRFPPMARTYGPVLLAKWIARLMAAEQYRMWQSRSGRGTMLVHEHEAEDWGLSSHSLLDPYELMRSDHSSTILPSLLQYGDTISMAHGIESRLPFLDYRLVEWVFKRRPALFEHGFSKPLLRTFLTQQGYVAHARRRDKKGFATPTRTWIDDNSEWVEDVLLSNRNAELWQYIRFDKARDMFQPTDFASAMHSYKLISLHVWLESLKDWRKSPVEAPVHPQPVA